jgi:predicted RNA-binding protein with TRAM domain
MGRFFRSDFRPAPVREGDVKNVTIEAVGEKGDGIARVNGFVVFVPGKKEGETVKIRITKVLRKVAFSEVVGEASASAAPAKEAAEEPAEEQESTAEIEEPAAKPAKEEKKPKKAKKEPKVEIIKEESEEF